MSRFGVPAGRPSRCRLGVVSIAVLAMLSPLGVVSSAEATVMAPSAVAAVASPPQAAKVSSRIRITPSTGVVGMKFKIRGVLPNVKSRPVILQFKVGTSWWGIKRSRTTRTGAYVFPFTVTRPGSRTFRVWAPRAKIAGRMQASYATPARTLRVRQGSKGV
jgi:hypothetical protein